MSCRRVGSPLRWIAASGVVAGTLVLPVGVLAIALLVLGGLLVGSRSGARVSTTAPRRTPSAYSPVPQRAADPTLAGCDSPPALVSVVMCALDAAATIGEQLEALAAQTYLGKWELIVVDDGSVDDTAAIVRSFESRIRLRVVRTPSPGGQARARNFGSAAAAGSLLAYCDSDDVADPGWLAALVRSAAGCAAVGGHLEEDRLNDDVVRQWRPPTTADDLPVVFENVKVPVGANCAVWKCVFDELGGFEETISFTGDDVDFFWRVALAGHEIRYVPEAVMHYRHRDTVTKIGRQAFAYGRGNILLYERFRSVGLSQTSVADSIRFACLVAKGIPGAMISRARRGAWTRFTWFLIGQAVESRRLGVWHLG